MYLFRKKKFKGKYLAPEEKYLCNGDKYLFNMEIFLQEKKSFPQGIFLSIRDNFYPQRKFFFVGYINFAQICKKSVIDVI
jgi:hypothetical protein